MAAANRRATMPSAHPGTIHGKRPELVGAQAAAASGDTLELR